MNNFKKIGLTALGTSLIASSAYAGALSVTGSASITFSGNDSGTGGNNWSMSDSVTFSGGGEMDNGWSVTASYELDNNENVTTSGSPCRWFYTAGSNELPLLPCSIFLHSASSLDRQLDDGVISLTEKQPVR